MKYTSTKADAAVEPLGDSPHQVLHRSTTGVERHDRSGYGSFGKLCLPRAAGRVEDEATLGMLADGDTVQHLDLDALLK
ncbi:hypothetical protein [Nocardia salmonicida]|uniref:hypothetical protein n=1 Tax=Nocardia salmonicida TaxID=53431 RepID=UPI000AB647AA|nr:hypothetical protein [Nocardia salmonicida]